MGLPYDPHEVERRWQQRWADDRAHEPDLDSTPADEAFVNLAEFPYPSAEGLHVGHVFRYAGIDVYGRMLRMQGKVVLQPMGYDAFGINAENYALKIGQHPAQLIARTTQRFRQQLDDIGAAWDWRAGVDTSDPSYYRWTQWVFLRLFEAGLAYQAEAPVLWCPSCLTVLAREQTEGDRCERCDTEVAERVMRQWFLRITDYAERLLDGLDDLDWPERSKRLQRAWVGKADDGTYRLHDWLISRQRYWGPPIPIVHCEACGPVGVPDDQLPVRLPEVDDVAPPGDGRSPLAAVDSFVRATCPGCGGPGRRETDVSDTFLDSAWYFLRYVSAGRGDDQPWDDARVARWLPAGFYGGGPEHVQRHHLYARFVCMALHDLGHVPFAEPFPVIRLGGMITHAGARMSKSRGNVVNPDAYWAEHGRDVLRCALLFSGPWDKDGTFHDRNITGIERFFAKLWRRVDRAIDVGDDGGSSPPVPEEDVDRAIREVTAAIDRRRHNVAIARLMELLSRAHTAAGLRVLVVLLAPLAPYLAEELWHRLTGGADGSVHRQPWPTAGPAPTLSD